MKIYLSSAVILVSAILHAGPQEDALIAAVNLHDMVGVEAALTAGAKANQMDQFGRTPLMWACYNAFQDVVERLLPITDVTLKDTRGRTALREAIVEGSNADIVRDVLAKMKSSNADINAPDIMGNSALHEAAIVGNTTMLRELLAYPGIQVNAKNKLGITPLMAGCYNNKPEAVAELISVPGIGANDADQIGQTALIWAVKEGGVELVRLLISKGKDKGIDLNAKDKYGNTALAWANKTGNKQITLILRDAGAQ